jgi:ABC-type dipeptide/oligopeptide/nickel transport system ATPase component
MPEDKFNPLLQVKDLKITFYSQDLSLEVVKGIGFSVGKGKTIAIVGESGSGKSVTAMALTQLLPLPPVCQISGKVLYEGRDLLSLSHRKIRCYRGKEIAYIFQEPTSSLNPVFTIGYQVAEAVKLHLPHVKDARGYVIELLHKVGIRAPEQRYKSYPHELSGGMQQRAMIAMALACEPKLLVADEPTTALDVTIQAQIIELLKDLKQKLDMSVILITHNFGIISDFADDVIVMFRGEIVEKGCTDAVMNSPQHPYTKALLACIPRLEKKERRLKTIDYSKLRTATKIVPIQ